MSTYDTGSATVKVNAATVWGNGTAFTTYVEAGDQFHLRSEATFYQIAAVNSATNLTLNSGYANSSYAAGTELSSRNYQIITDFTPYKNIPEISPNDANFQYIYTKGARVIDSAMFKMGTGRGVRASYTASGGDQIIVANASCDVTLPETSSSLKYYGIRIVSNTASKVRAIVASPSSETINGLTNASITSRYGNLLLMCATAGSWISL